jgi:hypothetical protein
VKEVAGLVMLELVYNQTWYRRVNVHGERLSNLKANCGCDSEGEVAFVCMV